jgi:hypothetical protein
MHQKVLETYSFEDLLPGAVLVLRQVSVFSPAKHRYYVSITPDNIAHVFPAEPDTGLNVGDLADNAQPSGISE